MTDRERFVAVLTDQPADRVPFIKVFGGKNSVLDRWKKECPGIETCIDALLGFEGECRGWDSTPIKMGLASVGHPEVVEESETRKVVKWRTGEVEILQKGQDFYHQTVEFPVKDRSDWQRLKERHLQHDDPDRVPNDWPDHVARYRRRSFPLQLTHRGVYGFPRKIMGDEALAYAFFDDPELVHDMMESYTTMAIAVWERMTAEVEFDLIECWEDMAYRGGSIVSPRIFRDFMKPQYQRIAAFATDHRIPIILVDSDGYVEDLVPLMAEAGVTAMYPFEVQSGNDVARVRRRHPTFACIGGLDKESMARGRDAIDAEVDKARALIRMGRYIPGPDHFVLSNVSLESYRYFMERLLGVVMTTRVPRGLTNFQMMKQRGGRRPG